MSLHAYSRWATSPRSASGDPYLPGFAVVLPFLDSVFDLVVALVSLQDVDSRDNGAADHPSVRLGPDETVQEAMSTLARTA